LKYIYNICIYIYWLGIFIASWFNNKAKLFIKGREGLIKRVENEVKSGDDITWIHCSSVGEFEQARPVIEKIKKENNSKILLTFFSPSGYELRKNYNLADWVYYMPLDTRKNAKAFIKAINPKRAIFVKYEFWYNHLYELKRNNIDIYIISAIFRPGQIFFKWYGFFFRKMLHLFTILFVQDERSKHLLEGIGITNNVIIGGDTRFDRVNEIASKSKDLPIIESFAKEHFTLVAGSSWEPDELMLAKTLKNFSKAKLILAPHEIGSDRIKKYSKFFLSIK
jgi:3-deoxy-D-manno-octulosonic-acid transferase